MCYEDLRNIVIERLDQADRADRAWWLLTRVHLSSERVSKIASYLYDVGGEDAFHLTETHYREIARLVGSNADNPIKVINRHYFLSMLSPLRLIERLKNNRWSLIRLTENGVRLANDPDVPGTCERVLSDIRFCREPWYTASRVQMYNEFDVNPYPVVLKVMQECNGYIDTDEFDLFVSRIRTEEETSWASENIPKFRNLTVDQKKNLLLEVKNRIPHESGNKPYQNWRDMGQHTFSLFALGQNAYRSKNMLVLSAHLLKIPSELTTNINIEPPPATEKSSSIPSTTRRKRVLLRIPDTKTPDAVLIPPRSVEANTGNEAENLVGKILAAGGWQVVYYSNRRGYGFDIWAKNNDIAFVIEVKSSLGMVGDIVLTRLEYEAAEYYKDSYLLIIVEEIASNAPAIRVIQDPANTLEFIQTEQVQYRTAAEKWRSVAISSDFTP